MWFLIYSLFIELLNLTINKYPQCSLSYEELLVNYYQNKEWNLIKQDSLHKIEESIQNTKHIKAINTNKYFNIGIYLSYYLSILLSIY
jgi:hypothetical protein